MGVNGKSGKAEKQHGRRDIRSAHAESIWEGFRLLAFRG